jgi:hypothetical protein
LQDSPARMQTGPATRGDHATVKKHLDLLASHPDWQQLYQFLSRDINPEVI